MISSSQDAPASMWPSSRHGRAATAPARAQMLEQPLQPGAVPAAVAPRSSWRRMRRPPARRDVLCPGSRSRDALVSVSQRPGAALGDWLWLACRRWSGGDPDTITAAQTAIYQAAKPYSPIRRTRRPLADLQPDQLMAGSSLARDRAVRNSAALTYVGGHYRNVGWPVSSSPVGRTLLARAVNAVRGWRRPLWPSAGRRRRVGAPWVWPRWSPDTARLGRDRFFAYVVSATGQRCVLCHGAGDAPAAGGSAAAGGRDVCPSGAGMPHEWHGDGLVFEPKLDGWRCLALHRAAGRVRFPRFSGGF